MLRPSRRAPRTEAGSRSLLQAHGLTFAPHHHLREPLFRDLSFSIHPGEIVALAGANGAGKTTLLRCLDGDLTLDHGTVERAAELEVASVAQCTSTSSSQGSSSEAVRTRLFAAQTDLAPLLGRLDHDWNALDEWRQRGGYEREARIEQHAHQFGIDPLLERDCSELSLGQLRKVDLVAALSSPAQLLLLDEPLNYLDLQGILAFENALLERRQHDPAAAALLISHDRELLDRVADRTLHLTSDGLLSVTAGYSAARQERQRQHRAQTHKADEMRKRIRNLERQFRQRKSWAQQKERSKKGAGAAKPFIAKKAKKMMKRAKDLERRRDQQLADLRAGTPEKQRPVKIETPVFSVARRRVALLEEVSKSFEEKEVLRQIDLRLETTSRTALLGANGAGKSTLLRLVLGLSEPSSGSITRNPGVRIGALPQNLEGFFTGPRLLDDFLGGTWTQSEARKMLGSIGLRRERVFQAPESLSQGETTRAALVRLILERYDFLVLDEPTSHLDVQSIEALESVLQDYPGGFLMVTHDRRLVANVAEELWSLGEGTLDLVI